MFFPHNLSLMENEYSRYLSMLKCSMYDGFGSSYRILTLKLLPVVDLTLEVPNLVMKLKAMVLELCSHLSAHGEDVP